MKRLNLIFAAVICVVGIAVVSCTKENASTPQSITSAADAVQTDNAVVGITDLIDDYQSINTTAFVDPTLKAAGANNPVTIKGLRRDSCATVTIVKTPTLTGTTITGATVTFKIDFGTTGCLGHDGKARRGTITSTFTWVKAGGWSRVSTIDLYVSDVHHVGTQASTFGVTGAFNHALFTEVTDLTITAKDGTWKKWSSNYQRELIEGNAGATSAKIFKITGSSTFSNSAGETASYTITVPLTKPAACKTPTAGTVVVVNKAGVSTTIDYGTGTDCKTGVTIKFPGDKNGKGALSRFIKFGI